MLFVWVMTADKKKRLISASNVNYNNINLYLRVWIQPIILWATLYLIKWMINSFCILFNHKTRLQCNLWLLYSYISYVSQKDLL